jgi:hypothetical protein
VKTFRKIVTGSYSDTYKEKLKDTYRYFHREGFEFQIHALNRTLGQKKGKGKVSFTKKEIVIMLRKQPNYIQEDGRLVRFENGIAIFQAPDTGEIISIVTRNKPKDNWREV